MKCNRLFIIVLILNVLMVGGLILSFKTKDVLPQNQIYTSTVLNNDITVTVGEKGDFKTINDAMSYLSQFYPQYRNGGIKANICILKNTIISEQVLVVGADYSWMNITYEGYKPRLHDFDKIAVKIASGEIIYGKTKGFDYVPVDSRNWKSNTITHDTRGNVCLFRAEDGGRLPKISCVFKLVNKSKFDVAGLVCNRGSSCVVGTLCGFIGFNDGVIANNESTIVIREGITIDCGRWGCHARHNGEISARSVIATGCATDSRYSNVSAALSADRIADLDGREAWVSTGNAFQVHNTSRMNCNGTHIVGSNDDITIINASSLSFGNFSNLHIDSRVDVRYSSGAHLLLGDYMYHNVYDFNVVTDKGVLFK